MSDAKQDQLRFDGVEICSPDRTYSRSLHNDDGGGRGCQNKRTVVERAVSERLEKFYSMYIPGMHAVTMMR